MRNPGLTLRRAHRQPRRSQRGFTLIELVVAMAITTVLVATLAAAIALSVRLVGPQGVAGQQAASNDVLAVERSLSTDVSHAECVITPGGSCPGTAAPLSAACQGGFTVCVAWCEAGSPHAVTYSLVGAQLVRAEAGTSIAVVRHVHGTPTFDATIPNGSSSPQLAIDLVAGTDRPQRASFTARSLVTGDAACP